MCSHNGNSDEKHVPVKGEVPRMNHNQSISKMATMSLDPSSTHLYGVIILHYVKWHWFEVGGRRW
jgi:hypothetical protein